MEIRSTDDWGTAPESAPPESGDEWGTAPQSPTPVSSEEWEQTGTDEPDDRHDTGMASGSPARRGYRAHASIAAAKASSSPLMQEPPWVDPPFDAYFPTIMGNLTVFDSGDGNNLYGTITCRQLVAQQISGGATTGLSPSGDTSGATDAAAIQAAIGTGKVTVQLGAGDFYVNTAILPKTGLRLTGASYKATTINGVGSSVINAGATQTDNVEIDHLTLSATGSDLITGANCIRWNIHHCQLVQNSAGNSIWAAASVTLMIECTFNLNTERVFGATRSVPAWSLTSAGTDLITQCYWEKNVCFNSDSDATQYYFSLVCSAGNALLRNLVFRDLTFEHACGGMIHLESVSGTLIENVWSWDTPANSILQASINIIKNSGNSAVPAGTTIVSSGRVADGINAGVADIKLGHDCTGTTIQDCGAFGTGVAYVIDLATSSNVVLIGLQSTVSLVNANAGMIRIYGGAYLGNTAKFQQAAGGGQILQIQNTTGSPTQAAFLATLLTGGDKTYGVIVSGDTDNRWVMDSNGVMQWGPGNLTQDVNLYRQAAGILATDNVLFLANNPVAPGTPTGGGIIYTHAGALHYLGSSGTDTVIAPA